METIIRKENMRVKMPAEDWQEAIRQVGSVLKDAGSITDGYVNAMIEAVREFGPYIVIMPGFALAHAAPSAEVLREDMALITLEKPVCFGSANDPVSVMLCVACVDQESHIRALQKVALALGEEDIFGRMADAGTIDELYGILHHV